MSSILGHSLAGVCVASAVGGEQVVRKRKLLILTAVLALVPDLDVIIYIAFGAMGINPHRGITHTLLFTVLAGASISLLVGKRFDLTFAKGFVLFTGVLLSHLVLDYLMGAGPGVPFFWPLSDQGYLFPYKIVPTAYYTLSATGILSLLFYPPTLIGLFFEALIFLPLFLMLTRKATLPRWFLVTITIVGLLCTLVIYNVIVPTRDAPTADSRDVAPKYLRTEIGKSDPASVLPTSA
jgi:Predicted membrane-bound metal-dependent hydrolase (DUF457).